MDANILSIAEIGENAFIYNIEALLIVLMNFLLIVSNPVRPSILKHVFKSNFFYLVVDH